MISNISTILYIISTCEQRFSNKILQTGTAACKIDADGDFLPFRYTLWLQSDDDEFEDHEEASYIQRVDQESVYFVTGNFTILDTGSLELVISSCKNLKLFL